MQNYLHLELQYSHSVDISSIAAIYRVQIKHISAVSMSFLISELISLTLLYLVLQYKLKQESQLSIFFSSKLNKSLN